MIRLRVGLLSVCALGLAASLQGGWGYEFEIERLRYGDIKLEGTLFSQLILGEDAAWNALAEGVSVDLGADRRVKIEPIALTHDPESGSYATLKPLVVSELYLAPDLSLKGRFDFAFTPPERIALRAAEVSLFGGTLIIEPTTGTIGAVTLTAHVRNLDVSQMLKGIPNFQHRVEATLDGDLSIARRGSVFYIISGRLALSQKAGAELSITGEKGWLVGQQPETPWWQKLFVGEQLSPYRTEDALANLRVQTMQVEIDARAAKLVDVQIAGLEAKPPKGAKPLQIEYNPSVKGEGDINSILKMIFRNALDVRIGIPPDLETK